MIWDTMSFEQCILTTRSNQPRNITLLYRKIIIQLPSSTPHRLPESCCHSFPPVSHFMMFVICCYAVCWLCVLSLYVQLFERLPAKLNEKDCSVSNTREGGWKRPLLTLIWVNKTSLMLENYKKTYINTNKDSKRWILHGPLCAKSKKSHFNVWFFSWVRLKPHSEWIRGLFIQLPINC